MSEENQDLVPAPTPCETCGRGGEGDPAPEPTDPPAADPPQDPPAAE